MNAASKNSDDTGPNPIRILLVDDNPSDARIIRDYLGFYRDPGFAITVQDRLGPGVGHAGVHEFDLMLLDLSLPDSLGLETFKTAYEWHPDLPIVVLTGLAEQGMAIKAMELGAQDFLNKNDLTPDLLFRSVRYAVERKRAEEKLSITHRKLKESQTMLIQADKMSSLGTLAAGVAHELNNPLMGILNFSEYCLKHTSPDDRRCPVLQDLVETTERCIEIVDNLLTFSRKPEISEGEFEIESIRSVVDRVLKLLAYRIDKENVAIVQNWPASSPMVPMRSNELQQVFLNLIVNAVDAMAESKEKRLEISSTVNLSRVIVKIADTGEGIPSGMLKTIFDPFFTTKPPGKGTGLGLAICYSLVRNHGGDIFCASAVGQGATFSVSLPLPGRTG